MNTHLTLGEVFFEPGEKVYRVKCLVKKMFLVNLYILAFYECITAELLPFLQKSFTKKIVFMHF